MATLLLTALGTAIGGPIGGSIGALIGHSLDARIFGPQGREGPRLRDLAVSTSSYGQPIPRQFGRMRVPGTVIWSTDLLESKHKEKSRKGQPSTTVYSYSASFAVALSSTPISRVGRIWADGNLLRGVQDDLKVGGLLRIYRGFGDDPVDPLIAAAKGGQDLHSATAPTPFSRISSLPTSAIASRRSVSKSSARAERRGCRLRN